MSARRVRPGPTHQETHAAVIAEAVVTAWSHTSHGSSSLDIPLSTVAALVLLRPPAGHRDAVTREWLDLAPTEFAARIRGLWGWFVITRPDLFHPASPLLRVWLDHDHELDRETVVDAKHAADAALRANLIGVTGTHHRDETDLLGILLTVLRRQPEHQDRGQYYTPPDLARAQAEILLHGAELTAGQSFYDPAVATGGLLRAVAQHLRGRGLDPADFVWEANDPDALAVACLAVNVVLWRLGRRVLVAVGDTLTDEFRDRALRERRAPVQALRDLLAITAVQALTRSADPHGGGDTDDNTSGVALDHTDGAGRPDPAHDRATGTAHPCGAVSTGDPERPGDRTDRPDPRRVGAPTPSGAPVPHGGFWGLVEQLDDPNSPGPMDHPTQEDNHA